jgi:hypothetical protein
MKTLTLQELALLRSYLSISLEAILDPPRFKQAKNYPRAHYLTNAID